jgi:hypothetical protein
MTAKKSRTPKAPTHVRFLMQAVDPTLHFAEIDRAFAKARDVISKEHKVEEGRREDIAFWVQEAAEAYMSDNEYDGGDELLAPDSLYRRLGGTIQTALADPALTLGFCLAYVLLTEQGGTR